MAGLFLSNKASRRNRFLLYLGVVVALLAWLAVSYQIDQKREHMLAELREMHRQGRAADFDAIFNDPGLKLKKRALQAAVLLVVFVGAREWAARKAEAKR